MITEAMPIDRIERVNALLRREIAAAVPTVMSNEDVDCAVITITQVSAARNLRNARVSVSIFGHEGERGTILRKLANRHAEFQRLINRDMKLKYTPVLRFVLDESIEKGDHILNILNKLEVEPSEEEDESLLIDQCGLSPQPSPRPSPSGRG